MKSLFMVFLLALAASLSPEAYANSTTCLNISGKYSAPWDTKTNKTTFSYNQTNCEFLIIGGYVIDYARPSSSQFHTMTAYLDGQPPVNEGLGPCYGAAPRVCASYTATPSFIIKTLDQSHTGFAASPAGALCTYHVSHISKDTEGNLIEDFQIESCDDGYTGKIAPMVFPAAK